MITSVFWPLKSLAESTPTSRILSTSPETASVGNGVGVKSGVGVRVGVGVGVIVCVGVMPGPRGEGVFVGAAATEDVNVGTGDGVNVDVAVRLGVTVAVVVVLTALDAAVAGTEGSRGWVGDGSGTGLDVGLSDGLDVGLSDGLDVGLSDGPDVGLSDGLDVGLPAVEEAKDTAVGVRSRLHPARVFASRSRQKVAVNILETRARLSVSVPCIGPVTLASKRPSNWAMAVTVRI
jgi:hypothetical protein